MRIAFWAGTRVYRPAMAISQGDGAVAGKGPGGSEVTPPPPPVEGPPVCQRCGAAPEPGYPLSLCAPCRTALAHRPVPAGIKAAAVAVLLLLAFALTRIPKSVEAAVAFEKGRRAEEARRYAEAAADYRSVTAAFPQSVLAQARLFVAQYRAHDAEGARETFQHLAGRKVKKEIAAEVNGLLRANGDQSENGGSQ